MNNSIQGDPAQNEKSRVAATQTATQNHWCLSADVIRCLKVIVVNSYCMRL